MKKILLSLFVFWGALQAGEYWGYHLVLDCKGCDIETITSRAALEEFAKILVDEIDMKAYGQPQLVNFAAHNPEAAGFTLVQLIETSAITGHFIDQNGDAYIDIFSCKAFDPEVATKVVERCLSPENITSKFLKRKA